MPTVFYFAIALLVIGGLILGGLSAFTWRESETSTIALPILLAAAMVWVLAAAAEHLLPTLDGKVLASKIQYLGILALPPASLCTILAYVGKEEWIGRFLKFAFPFALVCWGIVLTNDFHHGLWANIELISTGDMSLLGLTYGPIFWVITVFSHGQLVLGASLFFFNSWKNWQLESTLVLLGFAAPWVANMLYVSGASPITNLDITPFGLIVTGVSFAFSFHSVGSIFSTVRLANRDIVECIEDIIFVVDDRQRVVSANHSAHAILASHPLPAPIDTMLVDQPELLTYLHREIQSHHRDIELVLGNNKAIFDIRPMDIADQQRPNRATVYVLRDVTSERAVEGDLRRHRQQLRQIIDLIPHPIYARDAQGHFLFANDSCASAYGFSGEDITGHTIAELHQNAEEAARIDVNDRRVMETLQPLTTEELFHNDGSEPRTFKTTKVPFRYDDSDTAGIVAMSIDITQERERESMLQFLASTDPLTNLPNRRHFHDLLSKAMARAAKAGHRAALLSLDLDRFKMVNDNYGHPVGDDVLRQVAERLTDNLRFSDQLGSSSSAKHRATISRLGGDEFMVLLPSIVEAADAALVARRLIEALHAPFEVGSDRLQLGTSIGIALCPEDGDSPEAMIRRSDQALSNAKSNFRGSYEFFNAELSAAEERRHVLEQALRRALDRNEFCVHYQPIRDTQTAELSGAEALIRWESAELGIVNPDEFIPVAEESGLIVKIGEVVLRSVCEQISQWRQRDLQVPTISVNLSARQLIDLNLQEQVQRVFDETGVRGPDIQFELTEGSMLVENPRSKMALAWLQGLGTSLALDDFGTGYSSLSLLRKLSFQRLKIDRSFVSGLGSEPEDERLVRGVIALAHRLHIDTVAEGVETEQQLEILRSEGCNYIQGYLFGRPEPPDLFERLLEPAGLREKP